MIAQTLKLGGRRYVVLEEGEYDELLSRASGDADDATMPPLPDPLPNGNYPAIEYARAVTAREIIRSRRRLGLTQAELARLAGIRPETLNRIEKAKITATPATIDKLDAAIEKAGKSGTGRT